MIDQKFFQNLRNEHQSYKKLQLELLGLTNQALSDSKRAIFALHRHNIQEGKKLIIFAKTNLKKVEQFLVNQNPNLASEGSLRAAQEEFVEAVFFYDAIGKKKIQAISGINIGRESYLGGLCDTMGELYRYNINLAAIAKFGEVKKMHSIAQNIMGELVKFDFTGYLRTKYDQAKNSMRKMEEILYEIAIRKKD